MQWYRWLAFLLAVALAVVVSAPHALARQLTRGTACGPGDLTLQLGEVSPRRSAWRRHRRPSWRASAHSWRSRTCASAGGQGRGCAARPPSASPLASWTAPASPDGSASGSKTAATVQRRSTSSCATWASAGWHPGEVAAGGCVDRRRSRTVDDGYTAGWTDLPSAVEPVLACGAGPLVVRCGGLTAPGSRAVDPLR